MENLLQKRINKKYPEEKIEVLSFSTMKEEAVVKCLRCGKIYTLKRGENFLRTGKTCICKTCLKKSQKESSQSTFKNKIKRKYPNEQVNILEYNKNGDCSVQCLHCEEIITLNEKAFLRRDKNRICPRCNPNKRFQIQETIKKFSVWEKTQSSFVFTPSIEIQLKATRVTSKTLFTSVCKKCGLENKKNMYDYLRGRTCGKCKKNILKTKAEFQQEVGDEYSVLEYQSMDKKALFQHSLCGFVYSANPRGYLCPRCKGSKGERKIRFFLKKHLIRFEEQKTWNISGHLLRTDFYLPDFNLIIEYNGEQHYHPIDFFGGETVFQRQQKYDSLKETFFKNRMLIISFTEYKDIDSILFKKLFKSSSTKRIVYPVGRTPLIKKEKLAPEADAAKRRRYSQTL